MSWLGTVSLTSIDFDWAGKFSLIKTIQQAQHMRVQTKTEIFLLNKRKAKTFCLTRSLLYICFHLDSFFFALSIAVDIIVVVIEIVSHFTTTEYDKWQ